MDPEASVATGGVRRPGPSRRSSIGAHPAIERVSSIRIERAQAIVKLPT